MVYYGEANGKKYAIQDEMASWFADKWAKGNIDNFVQDILSDKKLWGADLLELKGFAAAVKENLQLLEKQGGGGHFCQTNKKQ
ncbi:MAG: hypothetical protein WDO71_14575 [Bacteroidota bacterium]